MTTVDEIPGDVAAALFEDARDIQPHLIRLARLNCAYFNAYTLRDERTGKKIRLAPMHVEWHALIDANPRMLLWSFVEGGKTQQIAVGRPMFELGRDRSKRVALLSKTQGMAVKAVRSIARYIERSQDLARIFPDLRPAQPWTSTTLTVERDVFSRDPSIQACGVGGTIVGSRIDILIVDDILDWKNTRTPAQRAELRAWFQSEIVGRLTADAIVIVVGNAYHPEDLLHELARTNYVSRTYPVENPDGSPRFPANWTRERIQAKRIELGPAEAARQLDCVARKETDQRCQEAWVIACMERGIGVPLYTESPALPDGTAVFTGVDIGVKKKRDSAKTVLFTMAILPDAEDQRLRTRQLLALESGRWSAKEIRARVIARQRAFGGMVLVEDNGAQAFLIEDMAEEDAEVGYYIQPYTTGVGKWDPRYGVESIFAEFAATKWIIPSTRESSKKRPRAASAAIVEWLSECVNYSPERHTGDHLMACLAPGALVTTARGLVAIEDVVAGDHVLTHRGRWRSVTGATRHDHHGIAYRIRASGHIPFVATPNHPVWSAPATFERATKTNRLQPGRWSWTRTDGLRAGRKLEGDYVLSPVPRAWPDAASPRVDLASLIAHRALAWGGRWRVMPDVIVWRGEREQPRWLNVDARAALMVGLYLAEGSACGKPHQAVFSFHEREGHLHDFVRMEAMRLFNARTSVERGTGAGVRVVVHNAVAARFFAQLGKRERKGLPWSWMGWPLEMRLRIVRGWLLGDGTDTGHLSGVSVARAWLEQARLTLAEDGLCPALGAFLPGGPRPFNGRPGWSLPSWRLSLSESDSAKLLLTPLPPEREHWALQWRERERSNAGALPWNGDLAVRLRGLDPVPYAGIVHNLHVEEDESYVANGIAVHNSWFAKEGSRRNAMVPGGGMTANIIGADAPGPETEEQRAAREEHEAELEGWGSVLRKRTE